MSEDWARSSILLMGRFMMETVKYAARFAVYVAKMTTMNKDQNIPSDLEELVTDSKTPLPPAKEVKFSFEQISKIRLSMSSERLNH